MTERPEPDPIRARRVLALAALLVLAAQLAVGLALDRAPLAVRFAEAARVLAAAHARAPEVVLLGSSRTDNALDPALVEADLRARLGARAPAVASLAVDGGDLVASERILRELLAGGAHPRIALIELTPEWLRQPVPFLNAQLVRAFDWSDVRHWLPELLVDTRATLVRARLFPVYHYRLELLGWWVGRPPPYLMAPRAEPAPAKRRAPDDPEAGVRRWNKRLADYRVSERAEATLARLLASCRAAGIECVLWLPPASSAQRAVYTPALDEAWQAALLRAADGRALAVVDARARLADTEFRDGSHANPAGRERYSRIVAEELLAPRYTGSNTNASP